MRGGWTWAQLVEIATAFDQLRACGSSLNQKAPRDNSSSFTTIDLDRLWLSVFRVTDVTTYRRRKFAAGLNVLSSRGLLERR